MEISEYFDKFVSNTIAGSGNQKFFDSHGRKTGRVFYKTSRGGRFCYSFLFSNTIDSTFADGSESRANRVCSPWQIEKMSVGVYDGDFFKDLPKTISKDKMKNEMLPVTFSGEEKKTVSAGELFCTDPITIECREGDYICLETLFSGDMIPCHEESQIASYVLKGDSWHLSPHIPPVSMVGCNMKSRCRIGYIGDSITQGIGVKFNSYSHWNALVSKGLEKEFSFWNLGLGFARCDDFATCGAWMNKAKNVDVAFVCFGVNDLYQGFSVEKIKANLLKIIKKLKENNIKIILQTVPPFDYEDEEIRNNWYEVNRYIKDELSRHVDLVFDNVPLLSKGADCDYMAKYGGHPNETGCRIWADSFLSVLSKNKKIFVDK